MNFIFLIKIFATLLAVAVCTMVILLTVRSQKIDYHISDRINLFEVVMSSLFVICTLTLVLMFDFGYPSKCKKCDEPRLPKSNYCSVCGEPYEDRNRENKCPHCFTKNPEGSDYCKKCGNSLEVPEE